MKIVKGLVIIAICITLNGCGKENREIKKSAEEVVTVIESGNIEEINDLIWGMDKLGGSNELSDIVETEKMEIKQEGILSEIFKRNTIKVVNISENIIEYEMETPDLQGIFDVILDGEEMLDEEQLFSYMKEYITQAKIRKIIVEVPYIIQNGEIVIDYQNKEFIDGITGGLLSVYWRLYQEMLSEYMKEIEAYE